MKKIAPLLIVIAAIAAGCNKNSENTTGTSTAPATTNGTMNSGGTATTNTPTTP